MKHNLHDHMFTPPLTIEEIRKQYPDKADLLCSDPVHRWRAQSGIELIHKEPSREEQLRIWENWQEMSDEQKCLSEEKSLELFGMTNEEHYRKIVTN
ncbi:MAG: hypothetical protein UU98_C0035G0005 [Parcubacteria group bacterium GW2011_GWD2_42_14]|nr:MAG: hypothetical protein UU98_C0035G0005 [Parcubacteria group bacterium GW2011_GWD2_42_14]